MVKIQKILIIFGCFLSCIVFDAYAIEYRIISLDNAPVYIDDKKMDKYGKFSKGSQVTNWANCSYFYCQSIEKRPLKYFITKYDLNLSNHNTLGSYIYSLKPLSTLGTISDLSNWFNREYYALYSEEEPFTLEFDCPTNLPLDDTHHFLISFYDKDGIVQNLELPYSWDENSSCNVVTINVSDLVHFVGQSLRLTMAITYRDSSNGKELSITDNFNICFIKPNETN